MSCVVRLKKFDYQFFNLVRIYKDNRLLYISDNRDWLFHHLVNNHPGVGPFEHDHALRKERYILLNSLSSTSPIVIDIRKIFNIRFGVTIVRSSESGCDFFNFGTSSDDVSTLNRVNSQVEELTTVTKLIIEKSRNIITKISKQPFRLEDFSPNYKPAVKDDRLYLGIDYDYNYLTRKEIICLQQLTQGNTFREIAQLNNISSRTVEKHFEHIKHKLFCKTQYELGYLAAKLGIDSL